MSTNSLEPFIQPIRDLLHGMSTRITEMPENFTEDQRQAIKNEFENVMFFIQERIFNPEKAAPQLTYFGPEVEDLVNMINQFHQEVQTRANSMPAGSPAAMKFRKNALDKRDSIELYIDHLLNTTLNSAYTMSNEEGGGKRTKRRHRKSRKAKRKAKKTRRR